MYEIIGDMDWDSLLSGLIGSLLGAVIASVVAFLTARWQVKKTIRLQMNWEKERIVEREEKQNTLLTNNIITEIENNIEIAANPKHRYSWIYLSIDIWLEFRGQMEFLPDHVQTQLRAAYICAQQYNTMLDDRRVMRDHVIGGWDEELGRKIRLVLQLSERALESIRDWLDNRE